MKKLNKVRCKAKVTRILFSLTLEKNAGGTLVSL